METTSSVVISVPFMMHPKMAIKQLTLLLLSWVASAAYQPNSAGKGFGSSVILPLSGNVYPKGYYYATIYIGQPPKPYFLDVDTGSELTWLQCDAPCQKCTPAPHSLYKPPKDLIKCIDPICASLHEGTGHHCPKPNDQCDYEVGYADHGSSLGVLVRDSVPFKFTNGSIFAPQLAFGCGYNQEPAGSGHLPFTDGVLGLGSGKSSILAQMRSLGLTRNVLGHCLSGQGGGFLFFGDDILPKSGITWISLSGTSNHYNLGNADLQVSSQAAIVKGMPIIFDSGSTYTYFGSKAYNALVSTVKGMVNKQLKDAVEDKSLPICWKGPKPFKSIRDAAGYFKPLVLTFTSAKNAQFPLRPESYLIVSEHGNVCLGILNGDEVGLHNMNLIGDVSLQDKLVVYDNEKQQVGWALASCNRLPKS